MEREKFFHGFVVVLAEELEKAEDSAKGFLIIQLCLDLEFVDTGLTKILSNHHIFRVEVVIGINYIIGKISFFFILFDFTNIDKEITDSFD